jgi:hypothetical protein
MRKISHHKNIKSIVEKKLLRLPDACKGYSALEVRSVIHAVNTELVIPRGITS